MQNDLGDEARVKHILDAIVLIERYTENFTFNTFKNSNLTQDGCIRQLAIIGEASNHISEELKSSIPQIEWKKIIALRNILVHEYFGDDISVIWDLITKEIPEAKVLILQIVDDFYN